MAKTNWAVVPQTITVKGEEVEVMVKNVRFFPIEKGGEITGFGRLKKPILQITVQHHTGGDPLRVKWTAEPGTNGKFAIQWPDKVGPKMITTGSGKGFRKPFSTLQKIPCPSGAMVRTPGEKDEYDTYSEFYSAACKRFGEIVANECLDLFVDALKLMAKQAA